MPLRKSGAAWFDLAAQATHRRQMSEVVQALAKAFGQLADPAVVAVLMKTVLVTVLVFLSLGVGLYFALIWLGATFSADSSGFAEAAAAAIIAALAFWLLFRVVALAVLQFFADEIVAAVERKHFPLRADQACALPFRRDLANSLRGIGRALGANLLALPFAIVLLVTGIGPALLFLAVNAWLLGRELTDMAWLRHCGEDTLGNPVPKAQRILLGGVVAGIMVVPFANFLAPVLGAAAGTHLTHGAITRSGAGRTQLSEDLNG